MLLWCGSSSVRFHRFRCDSPKGRRILDMPTCRLDVTSLLAQRSMFPSQSLRSDCVDAMCEFSAETPSDSDEDEDPAYQNMNNALFGCFVQLHLWWFVGVSPTKSWPECPCPATLRWISCATIGTGFLCALGCERRKRPSEQSPYTSCHCLDVVQFCVGGHNICHEGKTNLDWSAYLSTTSVVFSLRWIVAFSEPF